MRYLRECPRWGCLSTRPAMLSQLLTESPAVDVTGTSKGKVSGTVAELRGPMTHGSRNQRQPGSIVSAHKFCTRS